VIEDREIVLSVKLEERDYEKFNHFFSKKKLIISIIIYLLLFTLCFIYFLSNNGFDLETFKISLFIFVPICFLYIILTIFANKFYVKVKSKNVFKSNTFINRETFYTINIEGISSSSDYGNMKIKWGDLYKVLEDENSLYLFISKIQALIIPKRFFDNSEDISFLKEKVLKNVNVKMVTFLK
jgi:hypothetical protein